MANTPEGRVKTAVKKRLEHYGVLPFIHAADAKGPVQGMFWMPVQGQFAVHGVHDFVGLWHGVFFSIETKSPKNHVDATEPQRAFKAAVDKCGGIAVIGARDATCVDFIAETIGGVTK